MREELLFREFTEELFKKIDISPSQYEKAVSHYKAVSICLTDGDVADDIYVQGSFAYGTVIRPFKKGIDADFDIDLVGQKTIEKSGITPENLKTKVRECIEASPNHANLLSKDEGKRCWTLNYAEKDGIGFHMDVLPCVNESSELISSIINSNVPVEYANTAIALTNKDKTTGIYSWVSGNARGLAKWFYDINLPYLAPVSIYQRESLVNEGIYASIEQVPDMVLRSPLQRVIQLLKRHRDCRFDMMENENDKPISIIITILTASIAKQQAIYNSTVYELLMAVATELSRFSALLQEDYEKHAWNSGASLLIRNKDGWIIQNPVNPFENFAERWAENNNAKAKAFFQWVRWVSSDLLFDNHKSGEHFNVLRESFGDTVVKELYSALDLNPKSTPSLITRTNNSPKPYRSP